jgi:hypothetical protein
MWATLSIRSPLFNIGGAKSLAARPCRGYYCRMSTLSLAQYVSVPVAAELLGVTRARVHVLIREGRLGTCRAPDATVPVWLIPRAAVQSRAKKMTEPAAKLGGWQKGRPRKPAPDNDLQPAKKSSKKRRQKADNRVDGRIL